MSNRKKALIGLLKFIERTHQIQSSFFFSENEIMKKKPLPTPSRKHFTMKLKETFHVNCRHQSARPMMKNNQSIDEPVCIKLKDDKIVQRMKRQISNRKKNSFQKM